MKLQLLILLALFSTTKAFSTLNINVQLDSFNTVNNDEPVTLESVMAKKQKKDESEKKFHIFIVPVIASTPANGFMFGIAPAANWILGDPKTTHYSSALSSLVFTTLKQFLFTLKGTNYFKDDKFLLMADWRYFITSQPTYGLGTGPQSKKMSSNGFEYQDGLLSQDLSEAQFMKFNFFRAYTTFLARAGQSRFFYGLGYHFDYHYKIDDQLLDLDTIPPAITSHYAFSTKYGFNPTKYILSGLSANFIYDSRDNLINPYAGLYAFASLKYNANWLGSAKSSSTVWLEFRDYFNLNKNRPRTLFALWAYGNFTIAGELPYLDLPAQGWDQFGRSGRAYPQGRFRGQNVIYFEGEFRFPFQKNKETWGGVVFANTTTASNKDAKIPLFQYVNPGVGAGLRVMLNKASRTNLCLDYAFGSYNGHGFYLSVNEVF